MRGITGGLTVLAVLLAACSTPPAEPETLAPVGSPGSTPGPTASNPPSPTESSAPADSPAESFLAEYVDTANAALADAEAMPQWRARFSDTCTVCRGGFDTATEIHDDGHSINGGQLVEWSARIEEMAESQATFLVTGTVAAAQVTAADGTVVEDYPAAEGVTIVYTVRLQPDGSWLVVGGELLG